MSSARFLIVQLLKPYVAVAILRLSQVSTSIYCIWLCFLLLVLRQLGHYMQLLTFFEYLDDIYLHLTLPFPNYWNKCTISNGIPSALMFKISPVLVMIFVQGRWSDFESGGPNFKVISQLTRGSRERRERPVP